MYKLGRPGCPSFLASRGERAITKKLLSAPILFSLLASFASADDQNPPSEARAVDACLLGNTRVAHVRLAAAAAVLVRSGRGCCQVEPEYYLAKGVCGIASSILASTDLSAWDRSRTYGRNSSTSQFPAGAAGVGLCFGRFGVNLRSKNSCRRLTAAFAPIPMRVFSTTSSPSLCSAG